MKKDQASYTTLKTLLQYGPDQEKAHMMLDQPKPPSKAMKEGNYIEYYIDGIVDEKLYIYEGKVKNGKVWEAFEAAHKGRPIILASHDKKYKEEAAIIKQQQKEELELLPDKNFTNQVHFEFEDTKHGYGVHGYYDYKFHNKTVDLKRSTLAQFRKQLYSSYSDFYYPLQAYIQNRASGLPFEWWVLDKDINRVTVIPADQDGDTSWLEIGEGMYEKGMILFDKYKNDHVDDMKWGVPEYLDEIWCGFDLEGR